MAKGKKLYVEPEPVKEETPEETEITDSMIMDAFVPEPPAPKPVEPEEIVLRFNRTVEIMINGIPYVGKEIKVKDIALASEIVRLAKEAYGWEVLV